MDPTTGHAHYLENFPGADVTPEELEFLKAMERFQRRHHRRYPTWREVLFVLKSLGYRRVGEATPPPAPPRSGEGCKTSPPSLPGKGAGGLGDDPTPRCELPHVRVAPPE
ncbi:MAG TPA: hypothetical protein VFG68_10115 [Fimbriiglobus sp.]|nr:hypothetical protein [Fimbriiglobus sp.]